jgi:hypothetical protein
MLTKDLEPFSVHYKLYKILMIDKDLEPVSVHYKLDKILMIFLIFQSFFWWPQIAIWDSYIEMAGEWCMDPSADPEPSQVWWSTVFQCQNTDKSLQQLMNRLCASWSNFTNQNFVSNHRLVLEVWERQVQSCIWSTCEWETTFRWKMVQRNTIVPKEHTMHPVFKAYSR